MVFLFSRWSVSRNTTPNVFCARSPLFLISLIIKIYTNTDISLCMKRILLTITVTMLLANTSFSDESARAACRKELKQAEQQCERCMRYPNILEPGYSKKQTEKRCEYRCNKVLALISSCYR